MNLASIPSPEQRRLASRALPGARLRAVHHRSASSSRSGSASGAGSRAAARPATVGDIAVWAVPFGLVGGRLYHVLTDPELYFGDGQEPDRPRSTSGAAGSASGVRSPSAALGAYIACRRKGIAFLAIADALAPGIAIAQAIGRWGNWFNQELYGKPTTLPWGLEIDPAHRASAGEVRAVRDLPADVPLRVASGTSASRVW